MNNIPHWPGVAWTGPLRSPSPCTDANAADKAASWFDAPSFGAGPSIVSDVPAQARGLSVEQHAERVLAHLRDNV